MIAEVSIVCASVVACYAMRLRVEYIEKEWRGKLWEASELTRFARKDAERASLRVDAYDARLAKLEQHVTALQGHVNAGVFGGRRA